MFKLQIYNSYQDKTVELILTLAGLFHEEIFEAESMEPLFVIINGLITAGLNVSVKQGIAPRTLMVSLERSVYASYDKSD